MITLVAPLLLATIGPVPTDSYPPLAWSPRGDWIAFVAATRPAGPTLDAFPLTAEGPGPAGTLAPADLGFRAWAVRVDDGATVLLVESDRPLSSPCWGPDGRSIALAMVADRDGEAVLDVLIIAPEERRTVVRSPLGARPINGDRLAAQAVAWSPDGDRLLVPDADGESCLLVDLDGQTVLRRFPGRFPSWSPDGGHYATFAPLPEGALEIRVDPAEPGAGPPATVATVARADQPVVWSPDGRSLFFMDQNGEPTTETQVLLRSYQLDPPLHATIRELDAPIEAGHAVLGLYMTFSDDYLDQYYNVLADDRLPAFIYHQGRLIMDRFHPFNGLGGVGAPSLRPGGEALGFRYGDAGPTAAAGWIDLDDRTVHPLAPDDPSRVAWIDALGRAAAPDPVAFERPTRLPLPAELTADGPPRDGVERLAAVGLDLTRRLDNVRPSDRRRLIPRLFFAYLTGSYEEAERALDALIPAVEAPDFRLRLLGVRAQLAMALDRPVIAREIVDYLRRSGPAPASRVEESAEGRPVVTEEPAAAVPWIEALWRLHRRTLEGDADGSPTDPTSIEPTTTEAIERVFPDAPAGTTPF